MNERFHIVPTVKKSELFEKINQDEELQNPRILATHKNQRNEDSLLFIQIVESWKEFLSFQIVREGKGLTVRSEKCKMWRRRVCDSFKFPSGWAKKYFNYETCTSTRGFHPKDRREFCSFLILMKLLTILLYGLHPLGRSDNEGENLKIYSWKFFFPSSNIWLFVKLMQTSEHFRYDFTRAEYPSSPCAEKGGVRKWMDERMNEKWIDGWTYLAHSSCNDWTNPTLNKLKRHTMRSERGK